METIYRANDGKEFTDEMDCVNYERQQKLLKNPFKSHIYIVNGKEIPLEKIYDYISNIFYLDIVSYEDWKTLKDVMYDNYGCNLPPCSGKWYYDTTYDEWRDFESLKNRYLMIAKILEKKD